MKNQKTGLKILFVSSEVVPFAKTGGLADVAGSLPLELSAKHNDVRIVMPKYKKSNNSMRYIADFPVDINQYKQTCIIRKSEINYKADEVDGTVPVYFIDNYFYFDRDSMYGHYDDAERFAFFCKSVIKMLPEINFKPDIIHCNDWQSGPICMMLKENHYDTDFYENISTVFTIHNLRYQGNYPKQTLELFSLDESYFIPDKVEFYGTFSFMKCGIIYADVINTVSSTYAKEIQTPEYGEKMDGLLKQRNEDLYGILNGINYEDFNPLTDSRIYRNYSDDNLENKKENKYLLQRELELPEADVPVMGFISRLANQKGLDILEGAMDEIMKHDMQFVLLGSGDPYYEEIFKNLKQKYPKKLGLYIGFNANLAQRIYAGCDMFLMPSQFEPCGLGQLISLKYATIPIVRSTGGLADTIQDFSLETGKGNGFSFSEYSSSSLVEAIERAFNVYNNHKDTWKRLTRKAFNMNFSWSQSAEKYIELYYLAKGKHQTKKTSVR